MVKALKTRLVKLGKSVESLDLRGNTHLSSAIRSIHRFLNNKILNSYDDDELYPNGWYSRDIQDLQQLTTKLLKTRKKVKIIVNHITLEPDLWGDPPKSLQNDFLKHVLEQTRNDPDPGAERGEEHQTSA